MQTVAVLNTSARLQLTNHNPSWWLGLWHSQSNWEEHKHYQRPNPQCSPPGHETAVRFIKENKCDRGTDMPPCFL